MTALKKFPWIGIAAVLATIITGSWTADGLKGEALFSDWFPILKEYKFSIVFVVFMLFILSFIWLYNYRKIFLAVKTLKQIDSCKPHECLILLLSTPNIIPATWSFPLKIEDGKGNKAVLNGDSLKDDIAGLNSVFWNWQQLLRGIAPHHETLKYVYLIGSEKSGRIEASFNFINNAEMIIKQYRKNAAIFKSDKPVNFENLAQLTRIINKAIQQFKDLGMNEKDIIIDVTGGQKTTSIAGAVVTFNSQATFQYVQTNEPYKVMVYDVIIQSQISL